MFILMHFMLFYINNITTLTVNQVLDSAPLSNEDVCLRRVCSVFHSERKFCDTLSHTLFAWLYDKGLLFQNYHKCVNQCCKTHL